MKLKTIRIMKTFSILGLTIGMALAISSCNNSTGGRGTPIDSTNENGAAPVKYESGNPDVKVDTTMHSQPMDQKARQDNSANRSLNPPDTAATPPSQSNTDKATTSGSSNGKNDTKKN